MEGWRGLVVLSFGLVIGVLLWLGVANLVGPPSAPASQVLAGRPPAPAEGVVGATGPAVSAEQLKAFLVEKNSAELTSLLAGAPFVHRGIAGPALYVITFRSCPSCEQFKDEEWSDLESAGVDLRWIVYARRDKDGIARSLAPERAMVAELALSRSYALLDAWFKASTAEEFYETAQLPVAAEAAPERLAELEAERALVDSLEVITAANGMPLAIPAFFWREADGWHALIGYDKAAFTAVKRALLMNRADAASEPVVHP